MEKAFSLPRVFKQSVFERKTFDGKLSSVLSCSVKFKFIQKIYHAPFVVSKVKVLIVTKSSTLFCLPKNLFFSFPQI